MKIFLPFKIQDIGGTSTFARKFKEGMEAAGHEVVYEYTPDYDVLFLIVQCPFSYLWDAKRRGKKIVQRLDGTYYWTVSGWRFPLMNAKAAYIRHLFTDFTIYQSEYSRECANRFLGKKRFDRSEIIYNGVDLSVFTPDGGKKKLRDNPKQQIFFTASAFRRKDQILPILEALDSYRQRYTNNYKLYIGGNFVGPVADVPELLKQRDDVVYLGKIKNADLPQYERASDLFLFTHLNPPCPNNVIESLACGLPICGVGDGAMPELVTPGEQGELITAKGGGFWRTRPLDTATFAQNIHTIMSKPSPYRQSCVSAAKKRFSLDAMSAQYVKVFDLLVQ